MNKKVFAEELVKLADSLTAANKTKYKGYTIEPSGMNFYVTDPSGHRAFGEVPASVETAKKWIDMDIREKGKKSASEELTAMEFPTQDAMDKYLKEHPDADKSKHKVKKTKSLSEQHPFNPKDPKNPTDEEIDKHNRELAEAVRNKKIKETPDEVEERLKKQMGDKYKPQEQRVKEETEKWNKKSSIASELLLVAKELTAIEFPTQDAYDKYMKEHPDADKSLHRVTKTEKKEAPAKKEESAKPSDSRSLSDNYIKRRKEIFKKDSGISHEEYENVEGKVKALAYKDDANYAKYEPLIDSAWKGYFKSGEKQLLDAANDLVSEKHLSKEEVGHILTRGLSEAKANVESWESGNNLFGIKKDAPKYDQYVQNSKNHLKDWESLIKKFKGGKAEAEKKSSIVVASELIHIAKELSAVNKFETRDVVLFKKDGKDVEAEVEEVKFNGGKYLYKIDKSEKLVPEFELKRAASTQNKEGASEMRERLTAQDKEAADILGQIEALEKRFAADDKDIAQKADEAAKAEKQQISNPQGVQLKDVGDQNAKANANWPVEDKMAVASALVKLANAVLADDDEEEDDKEACK